MNNEFIKTKVASNLKEKMDLLEMNILAPTGINIYQALA